MFCFVGMAVGVEDSPGKLLKTWGIINIEDKRTQ